ncbi:MAG: TRAP transporter large permease [Geminicoccaceae bacterium]|nr:TRAP transporter large permease [Geminicoccaceae bacterium]
MSITAFITVFFVLLFLGLPIGFVMAVTSALYFLLSGNMLYLLMLPERIFSGLDVFVLMSIPFFMLAGEIMNRAGMSDRLVAFSNMIVGRFRGGLAQVNVLASILFAGITGVALGDVAALGKIFIPQMEKQGYTRAFAAAVTAASSLVGPIIPPSTIIVLYGAIMGVSVGAMFAGAIIPGLLIGISDMIVVYYLARKRGYPRQTVEVTPRKFVKGGADASLAIVMPVIIVGGILGGVFTPTEAAAVAVIYALIVGLFVFRTLNLKDGGAILYNAVIDSSRLFFIIAGAATVGWVFAMENIPAVVEQAFLTVSENPIVLVLLINLFFLVMGMWMEPGALIILFAPVIAPLAYKAGLHPVQFGIMLIINGNIGLCTPPVGNVLFAVANIARIGIDKLARELLPFLVLNFSIILLVGYWADLSLWIPRMLGLIR